MIDTDGCGWRTRFTHWPTRRSSTYTPFRNPGSRSAASVSHRLVRAWALHRRRNVSSGRESKAIIGTYARTEYELYAAVAYQGHVALVPRSALRMRPHLGIAAAPVSGMGPSTAAVAMPAMGYEPAAAALADVAADIAREHIGAIDDARLPV
jgi:hypothetical protein